MSGAPTIDVVIPTFGQWDLTRSCLEHLSRQTVPHTVIVADNGSTDGTPGRVRESFPDAKVVELGANLGFPAACNRGVASGSGEIIVLLNNDVDASPDFLERLVRQFANERVGSAAALLVHPDGKTIDSVGLCADPTLAGFPRLRGQSVDAASVSSPVLAGPCGAGGAYRRAAWEAAGGLDEGVRFYGEDLDLALRIRSAGWEAVSAPDAVALHQGSATAGDRSSWQRAEAGFSRGYFARRYRLLAGRFAPRTLATEFLVVAVDAVSNRDVSALRGRVAGWRSAQHLPPRPRPPARALDRSIGFVGSLRMRRAVYTSRPPGNHATEG
jgi:GT2 family glycosyltransferase